LCSNYQSISTATLLLNHHWKGALTVPPSCAGISLPLGGTIHWPLSVKCMNARAKPYLYRAVADHMTTHNAQLQQHEGDRTPTTQAQTVGAVCPCAPKACQCHHGRQPASHIRHALTNLRLHKQDQSIKGSTNLHIKS
jgi:hypothetical protein